MRREGLAAGRRDTCLAALGGLRCAGLAARLATLVALGLERGGAVRALRLLLAAPTAAAATTFPTRMAVIQRSSFEADWKDRHAAPGGAEGGEDQSHARAMARRC